MNVLPVRRGDVSLIDGTAASMIADAMFALSTPSRVQILGCLLGGPLPVGDITVLMGMEQSAVSHQLRVLREAGLVAAQRHGKHRVYAISGDAIRELLTAARQLARLKEPGETAAQRKGPTGSAVS